ncbi:MAG: hypothetical protein ACX94C_08505 [Phycisphaerales bacterium]
MDHHDQYDSKTSQSKGISEEELKTYKRLVEAEINKRSQSEDLRLRTRLNAVIPKGQFELHVDIENVSKDAIRLVACVLEYRSGGSGKAVVERGAQGLPVVLRERDTCRLAVNRIDFDPSALVGVSLLDSDRISYRVEDPQIKRAQGVQANLDRLRGVLPLPKPVPQIDLASGKVVGKASFCSSGDRPALYLAIQNNLQDKISFREVGLRWTLPSQAEGNMGQTEKTGPVATLVGEEMYSSHGLVEIGPQCEHVVDLMEYFPHGFQSVVSNGVADQDVEVILELTTGQSIPFSGLDIANAIREQVAHDLMNSGVKRWQ